MWTRSAILGFLAALAAVAPAAAAAPSLKIQVTSVAVSITPHDLAPKGASKGDTVVYRDRLVNVKAQFGKKRGAVVGSDQGTMTFTGPHTATFAGIATLPKGTLTLKGPVTALPNGGLTIPVVGGSGRYAKAHGTLTVGPGQDRVLNTYTVAFATLPVA